MKHFVLTLSLLSAVLLPATTYADAGHAAGAPHGAAIEQSGSVHIHEDGTIEAHNDGAFVLATPWSPRWWMLMGVSLVLMGALSMWVQKYLHVQ